MAAAAGLWLKLQPAVHDAQRALLLEKEESVYNFIPALCQGAIPVLPITSYTSFMWKASLPSVPELGQPDTACPMTAARHLISGWCILS